MDDEGNMRLRWRVREKRHGSPLGEVIPLTHSWMQAVQVKELRREAEDHGAT